MAEIFISYRTGDSQVLVDELVRVLRPFWSVWYEPRIDAGKTLTPTLLGELQEAKCVIGVWSQNAHLSPFVEYELDYAFKQKKLLPVTSDGTPLPPHMQDMIRADLTGFGRLSFPPDFPRLLRGIQSFAGLPAGYATIEEVIEKLVYLDFDCFRIGNITIPAQFLFGAPSQSFSPSDVVIHDSEQVHELRPNYPSAIREKYTELLEGAFARFSLDPNRLRDNPMPRLDSWFQEAEGPNDECGKLHLSFSRTSYFQSWATNVGVDQPFLDSKRGEITTIRKSYCLPPFDDLSRSVLANNPGIEIVVISDNENQTPRQQMLIRKRGENVAGYRGWFQSSASGHLGLGHRDERGCPSPFVGAIAEARQEIADSLRLEPQDFHLMGLLLKQQDLHPSFYGYILTKRPAADLIHDMCRDSYEGKKSAIAFDPQTVLDHISAYKWFPLSAMAIIATLQAFFGYDAVLAAAKRVPVKRSEDFQIEDNRSRDRV